MQNNIKNEEISFNNNDEISVKVICRFRPMNTREINLNTFSCIKLINDKTLNIMNNQDFQNAKKKIFTYDKIFGNKSTQIELFELCGKPIISDILKGYNGTIFAYGQTGSGKTFTMEGSDIKNQETQGIIPRCIDTIFQNIKKTDENTNFIITVSYIEIYMEKIRDLLDLSRENLQINKNNTEIKVSGATEIYISSINEIVETLYIGAQNRAQASTSMNATSSRSHSVFTITVTQKNETKGTVIKGKLNLVDLAGSEKIRKTGAIGTRLNEAKTINTSLSALGLVIKKLTEDDVSHIPYRNSKLTRLLEESLGGNAKTTLIICCSPSSDNYDETVSTLRFGECAKKIKNKAIVNQELTAEELQKILLQTQKQNSLLRKKIKNLESNVVSYKDNNNTIINLRKQLTTQIELQKETTAEIYKSQKKYQTMLVEKKKEEDISKKAITKEKEASRKAFENAMVAEKEASRKAIENAMVAEKEAAKKAMTSALVKEKEASRKAFENAMVAEKEAFRKAIENAMVAEKEAAKKAMTSALVKEKEASRKAIENAMVAEKEAAKKAMTSALVKEKEASRKAIENAMVAEKEAAKKAIENAMVTEKEAAKKAMTSALVKEKEAAKKAIENAMVTEKEAAKKAMVSALVKEKEAAKKAIENAMVTEKEAAKKAMVSALAKEKEAAKKAIENALVKEKEAAKKAMTSALVKEKEAAKKAIAEEKEISRKAIANEKEISRKAIAKEKRQAKKMLANAMAKEKRKSQKVIELTRFQPVIINKKRDKFQNLKNL